jgi:3-oxoadipate enol-lactonase
MLANRFVRAGEIVLHYRVSGKPDGTPLIMINSLGTDLRIWDAVVPFFENDFMVVRYDKRGHGLSDCPPAPYSIRDMTQDQIHLMDALGIDRAIVIGLSVGGLIAMDMATAFPERIEQIIISDSAPKLGDPAAWNERIDTIRAHGMEYLSETILMRWFTPDFDTRYPEVHRGFSNMLTRLPVEGYTGVCEALRDADLREAVATIEDEVLIMCGAQDASTPPEVVEAGAEMFLNARFHLIEGAGHLPCVEQPDTMAALIRQFLKDANHV